MAEKLIDIKLSDIYKIENKYKENNEKVKDENETNEKLKKELTVTQIVKLQ